MVDPLNSSRLLMFYGGMAAPPGTSPMKIGRATASTADPFTWTKYASNPVYDGGSSISVDSAVLFGSTIYLYYTDPINTNGSSVKLATSTDGGFTFSPVGTAISPAGQGCTDGHTVSAGSVIRDDNGTWHMFYSYRSVDRGVLPGVRHATSADGITWAKDGCWDVLSRGAAGAPDSTYIEWHQVIKIGSTYVMTYDAYNGSYYSCNMATTDNLSAGWWTKSSANPTFPPTFHTGDFDQNHVGGCAFFQAGSTWYMLYSGTGAGQGGNTYNFGDWPMGIATLPAGKDPTSAIP